MWIHNPVKIKFIFIQYLYDLSIFMNINTLSIFIIQISNNNTKTSRVERSDAREVHIPKSISESFSARFNRAPIDDIIITCT